MAVVATIKFLFGAKICPACGSKNIVVRGFSGVNQRYDCKDCGKETSV